MNLLPLFAVGLAGSVHCVGMCGGIVGALSAGAPARTSSRSSPLFQRNSRSLRQWPSRLTMITVRIGSRSACSRHSILNGSAKKPSCIFRSS